MADNPRERALEAEIAKRDRIIRAHIRQGYVSRRGRKPSPMQGDLNVSRFPLTEFAMSDAGRHIPLPQTLDEVAETVGREAALRLAEGLIRTRTGSRTRRFVYVPSRSMREDHPIAACIGMELALLMQDTWANCIIEVPKLAALQAAYREHVAALMLEAGETLDDVVSQGVISAQAARQLSAQPRRTAGDDAPSASGGKSDGRARKNG